MKVFKRGSKNGAETIRFDVNFKTGLNDEQVKTRIDNGEVNKESKKVEKSVLRTFFDNTFTLFNIVLFSIALIFLIFIMALYNTGNAEYARAQFGISKFGFLIPAVLNSGIGTYQELHSKHVLAKLRLLNKSKATVIRDGKKREVASDDVVLDDILSLKAGEQCPVDVLVLDGEVKVDEGLLTGESDAIVKKKGDYIYSSSAILVGSCVCKADKVGDDTYAAGLSSKVRDLPRHKSELMGSITKIIHVLTYILLGVVAIIYATLMIKIHIHNGDPAIFGGDFALSLGDVRTWARINITVGSFAIGLIPEGLVLLTSIALAVSIVKLARQNTLIQELYSLENLSRVDTICLDKTGTLTTGEMKVDDVKYLASKNEVIEDLKGLLGAFEENNPTSLALIKEFGAKEDASITKKIPFSSATKCSGVVYGKDKEILLGAPEYLLKEKDIDSEYVLSQTTLGKRVLVLSQNKKAVAYFALSDETRDNAKSTLEFFYENNVDVKIISGDNLHTVSKIAANCGVKNADKAVSLDGKSIEEVKALANDYVIFARVSPEQKLAIIESLQENGHKAAMTGDGVNDILALRKANASITFAKATDAAKSCSDVVLLDNDFSHLKEVVGQGRRVVNNIERSSTLFLMKTFLIVGLAISLIPFPKGQMWYSVENIYLMQGAITGIGGFLLSLEPQKKPIRGSFLQNVSRRSIISGIFLLISALLPIFLNQLPQLWGSNPLLSDANAKSMISLLTAITGFVVMFSMCIPLSRYRVIALSAVLVAALVFAFGLPTSYVGGQTTSFAMFRSPDGNIFHAEVFRVAFQPWNSKVWIELNNEKMCYYLMGGVFLVVLPAYLFVVNANNKSLQKKWDANNQ
ncbi:MAG: HAD-IC family P-type ATPase [Bacilli bacterium]|nr:HAD-IC family P-type ATPase [Bacilli bacterium]